MAHFLSAAAPILSIIGILLTGVLGWAVFFRDTQEKRNKAKIAGHTEEISSLQAGATTWQGIAEDCREECAEVKAEQARTREELDRTTRRLHDTEDTLRATNVKLSDTLVELDRANRKIRHLEELVDGR